jgi:hypothetical protein
MTYQSEANVGLDQPRRYMTQLCKHFEHRLQVAYEGDRGSIVFGAGICLMQAGTDKLTLRVQSPGADGVPQLQDVVARHLLRFAFRAPPDITWTDAEPVPDHGVGKV